jgi:hypothetical protein
MCTISDRSRAPGAIRVPGPGAVRDCVDGWAQAGRVPRALVAGGRFRCGQGPRRGERRPYKTHDAEVAAAAQRPARPAGGRRTRCAARAVALGAPDRPGVRRPRDGQAARAHAAQGALPRCARGRGDRHLAPVPRPAPHVRDDDGAQWCRRRDDPGVDGTQRPKDIGALHALRASARGGRQDRRGVRSCRPSLHRDSAEGEPQYERYRATPQRPVIGPAPASE